jgi:gamma-glutamylcyclotransferase
MEESIKVFCYGSNMSSKRLKSKERCPNAEFHSIAELSKYSFSFNKKSTSGGHSGKANISYTDDNQNKVWGIVFTITKDEELALDKAEGFNIGHYTKRKVKVNSEGQEIEAIIYIVGDKRLIDNNEIPFDWYKEHCLIGAREFSLPDEYIKKIEEIESKVDTDLTRVSKEKSIYLK